MKTCNVTFCRSTDIFDGIEQAHERLVNSDCDISWGDSDFTLVHVDVLVAELERAGFNEAEIERFWNNFKSAEKPVDYVDMES